MTHRCTRHHLTAPAEPAGPFQTELAARSGGTLSVPTEAQAQWLVEHGWTLERVEPAEAPAPTIGFEEGRGQLHLFDQAGAPRLPFE